MSDPNANVPVGTIPDWEGQPRTVLRDYETILVPAMQLTLDGLDLLIKVLGDARAQILTYRILADEDDIGG